MRVTIGQINTTNGDYEGNVNRILRVIEQAQVEGAQLCVLPEVAVQGYTSQDWFLDRDIACRVLEPLERIRRATEEAKGLTVVVGTVRPVEPCAERSGRKLYNSAAVIREGEIVGFAIRRCCRNTTCSMTRATFNRRASGGCLI
jgi:NAD+ synthase (glutamine-hydrolysing)